MKQIKKYQIDKETHVGRWVSIPSPNVNVTKIISGDTEITDNNVNITNINFGKDVENPDLNDVFTEIDERFNKVERNVSWLAEHGGNGGGGGTIGGGSYGLLIKTPLDNNTIYIDGKKTSITFTVTGGTDGEMGCTYSYTYENDKVKSIPIKVNEEVVIDIDNTNRQGSQFTLTIEAYNPFNNLVGREVIFINELAMSFLFDTSNPNYKEGLFLVPSNSTYGFIPFKFKTTISNAVNVAHCTINGKENTQVINAIDNEATVNFSLWDFIEKNNIQSGNEYVVTYFSESTYGANNTTVSTTQQALRIRVISPDAINIIFSIDGMNSFMNHDVKVAIDDTFRYSLTLTAPDDSAYSTLYYAIKFINANNDEIIINDGTFDDVNYSINKSMPKNSTAAGTHILSSQFTNVDEIVYVQIKAWNYNGTKNVMTDRLPVSIIQGITNIYPLQKPYITDKVSTLFASWDISSSVEKNKIWKSHIPGDEYYFAAGDSKDIDVNITAMNANGSTSGIYIDENSVTRLRLQNHAYGVADLGAYENEVKNIFTNDRGFTISFTYQADEIYTTDNVVFLWGINDTENQLMYGFKIGVNTATMVFYDGTIKKTLSGNVTLGFKNTIDFVVDKVAKKAKLYINGVLNDGESFSSFSMWASNVPTSIYLGCDRLYNGSYARYMDTSVYALHIFSSPLNALQLLLNSKKDRLNGLPSNPEVINDYKEWLKKNFIAIPEGENPTPSSKFFANGDFIENFDVAAIQNIATSSNIPTLWVNCTNSTGFTRKYFYSSLTGKPISPFKCVYTYYDPNSNEGEVSFNGEIEPQGTTTLGYGVKNVNIMTVDQIIDKNGIPHVQLFQPKKDWFPESVFTAKADVVDSSHANNAVLGEWINNCSQWEDNPAMTEFNDVSNRPKRIDNNMNIIKRGDDKDYYEDLRIRHNLEGFPILMFIMFNGETSYSFIGIYSFNMGRNSYYNMGMKFLKSFSTYTTDGKEKSCPCIINYYEETDKLGKLNASDVFSFEFGDAANTVESTDDNPVPPLWTQWDKSILEHVGEFKYSGSENANIWTKLSEMFEAAARCPASNYSIDGESKIYTGFDNMPMYSYSNNQYIKNGKNGNNSINISVDNYEQLAQKLNIKNVAVYFVIANAFGMSDSIAKNLTLRTWDGGETWWMCFYDMDTALGLDNTGNESVTVDCGIDRFSMNNEGTTTVTGVTFHVSNGYSGYKSKIWGILKDTTVWHVNGDMKFYEPVWYQIRSNEGQLKTAADFTDMMEARVNTCGEMIYNYDYNNKYLEIKNSDSEVESAIQFLHGTRIEYVKNWLTRHLYYLDRIFYDETIGNKTFVDAPFYNEQTVYSTDSLTSGNFGLKVKAITPCFINVYWGANADKTPAPIYYFAEANKEYTIYLPNSFSPNGQFFIIGSSLLASIEGLNMLPIRGFMDTSTSSSLRAMSNYDINNLRVGANSNAFVNKVFVKNDLSSIESINFSGVKKMNGENIEIIIDAKNMDKLLSVNISNSDVDGIELPNTNLTYLNISNSGISKLELKNQEVLNSLDFTDCTKLNTITLSRCNNISSLNISNLRNLSEVTISECEMLETLVINNNQSLININVLNNPNLKSIRITQCTNSALNINVLGGKLETIVINDTNCEEITLPSILNLGNVTTLDLKRNIKLKNLKYNDVSLTYKDYPVFDLTPFTSLNLSKLDIDYDTNIKYLKVNNIESEPIEITSRIFKQSGNIERVFGHIYLTSGLFAGLKNFYINEEDTSFHYTSGTLPTFMEGDFVTNITIKNNSNISSCFQGTSCSNSDLYYIFMAMYGKNVTNVSNLFNSCSNISFNPPADIFDNCDYVSSIDGIFGGCDIYGKLPQGILMPVTVNSNYVDEDNNTGITTFNGVFGGGYYYIDRNNSIFPDGNAIKEISDFNPNNFEGVTEDDYVVDANIFKTLSNIVSISNSFNYCLINFQSIQHEAVNDELFDGCSNLKYIINSFNNMAASRDDTGMNVHHSPFRDCPLLEEIINSFSLDNNSEQAMFFITDDLFESCKDTLKYITKLDSNGLVPSNATTNGCFEGFTKLLLNRNGENDFPYDIFKGCENLQEIPGLFNGLKIINEDNYDEIFSRGTFEAIKNYGYTLVAPEETLPFPNGMFDDCESLTNLSNFFSEINGITVNFEPNGFQNTKIVNVSGMFSNTKHNGMIPYHMFYNNGEGIMDMSHVFEGSLGDGKPYTASTEDIENYAFVNGEWNKYIYDGSVDFYDRLTSTTVYNAHRDIALPLEFQNGYRTTPNLDEDITGFGQRFNRDFLSCRNYICPQDLFMYCKNVPEVNIDNALSSFGNIIGTNTLEGTYGCIPPYIFQPLTNIEKLNGIFSNTKTILPEKWGEYKNEEYVYGEAYPSDLFDNLTNLDSLNGVFSATRIWGYSPIPESILVPLSARLTDISDLFSNTIWGNGNDLLPIGLFSELHELLDISSLFENSNVSITSSHITSTANPKIQNCSSFMARCNNASGSVPTLWDGFVYMKTYSKCYYGISENVSNYSSIPDSYKQNF